MSADGPILGIVPARGGSKGVPGKNIKLLLGKPLLSYTAEAAVASGVVDRLVLSTDSEQIAATGRDLGIEVPFLRPAELGADDTPMLAVLEHVVLALAGEGFEPELIVLLQPTAPLRRPAHIVEAVRILRETDCDAVASVVELPRHLSPDYVMRIEQDRLVNFLPGGERVTRRQDARRAYSRDGTVYAFRTRTLREQGSIYGDDCRALLIDADDSVSIDTAADWEAAERALLARRSAAEADTTELQ